MKSALSYRLGRCENEASRRLHRGVIDTAQKLENYLSQVSQFTDLFCGQIADLRLKLKDYCERLIFTDPVVYGKKTEDLLWRKVFYEFFQKCKLSQKKLTGHDLIICQENFRNNLLAAIGLYHHILIRIQTEFNLELEGKVDIPFQWQLKGMKKERWKKYQQTTSADQNVQAWAYQSVHRILIYLGDLARYIFELNDPEYAHMAERYYLQAFCLNYKNGMPHNQLGSLSNNKFDSAYHYMRCLASIEKFDGAEGNLKHVFDKNNQAINDHDVSNNEISTTQLLGRFLKLCEIFYFSSDKNIQSLCHGVLQDFECWMQISEDARGNIFDRSAAASYSMSSKDEIVFKICIMSLMCRTKLEQRGSSDVAIVTAFVLALFSTIVRTTLKRLLLLIYDRSEKDKNENELVDDEFISTLKELDVSETDKEIFTTKTSTKRDKFKKTLPSRLRKLRRRRKISSTSQEDSELSDGEDPPDSDEENGILNSDGSPPGSDSSESGSDRDEDSIVEQKNLENENKSDKKNGLDDPLITENIPESIDDCKLPNINENKFTELTILPPDELFEKLKNFYLLQSLKILTDWLRTQPEVTAVCTGTSKMLLANILELLNTFALVETNLLKSKESFTHLIRIGDVWRQVVPLPEDILLMHLPSLEDIHCSLNFDIAKRRELSICEQIFLRLQCFLSFGDLLSFSPEADIQYNRSNNQFSLKQIDSSKKIDKNNKDISENVENSKPIKPQKQHVMHEMAHLWLKEEVNNLEALVENKSYPQLSPLLVTDTSALCRHLHLLKQLVAAKKFIVIVPKIVIDSLDQIKKKSLGAREAIRWLEYVFQKGSRHIRAQREIEKATLYPMKYPKKKEKDSWDFFQILECCHYLVRQQQPSDKTGVSLVTLIVGTSNQLPSNASALAKSLNINMENLENFFAKWRSSSKNPG